MSDNDDDDERLLYETMNEWLVDDSMLSNTQPGPSERAKRSHHHFLAPNEKVLDPAAPPKEKGDVAAGAAPGAGAPNANVGGWDAAAAPGAGEEPKAKGVDAAGEGAEGAPKAKEGAPEG